MHKLFFSALLAMFLTGAFFASTAQAGPQSPKDSQEVAVAVPTGGPARNTPALLDEALVAKHKDFSRFARRRLHTLDRNHCMSKSRMQIIKQSDGTFKARYHAIDIDHMSCKVRRSSSKSIPYVGVIRYKEMVMEATGATPEDCRLAQFTAVSVIPNRAIFSFKRGAWQ